MDNNKNTHEGHSTSSCTPIQLRFQWSLLSFFELHESHIFVVSGWVLTRCLNCMGMFLENLRLPPWPSKVKPMACFLVHQSHQLAAQITDNSYVAHSRQLGLNEKVIDMFIPKGFHSMVFPCGNLCSDWTYGRKRKPNKIELTKLYTDTPLWHLSREKNMNHIIIKVLLLWVKSTQAPILLWSGKI